MNEPKLYDVLAVNMLTSRVRLMGEGKDKRNAEAIENFAIMRQGVDENFFVIVNAGSHKEGDTYRQEERLQP